MSKKTKGKKNMETQTEVTKPQGGAMATYKPALNREAVLTSDMIIPRLLLGQGTSPKVVQREVQLGDIYKSNTGKIMGGPDQAVDFIPLAHRNLWVEFEIVPGESRPKYRGEYHRDDANMNDPWQFTKPDVSANQWKRMQTIDVFALLPDDIDNYEKAKAEFHKSGKLPAANDALFPVVVRFQSTSYNAGKVLATHFGNLRGMEADFGSPIPPFGYKMRVGSEFKENDQGSFYIFTTEVLEDSLEGIYWDAANKWHDVISNASNIKVDTSEEGTPEGGEAKASEEF